MSICARCFKETIATIMSMFNEQMICMACADAEKDNPRYVAAVDADEAACRAGNYNFKGIGL